MRNFTLVFTLYDRKRTFSPIKKQFSLTLSYDVDKFTNIGLTTYIHSSSLSQENSMVMKERVTYLKEKEKQN